MQSMKEMSIYSDIFRSVENRQQIRDERKQMQNAQMTLMAGKELSEIQKNTNQNR